MRCPYCGSKDVTKYTLRKLAKGRTKQRYVCKTCGKTFSFDEAYQNPKLLYFDIETSPILAYVWKTGKTWVDPGWVKEDWIVMSWAAKWVCDDQVFSRVIRPKEAGKMDDRRVVGQLWNLFDQADIIIGHNARWFDIKKMNWRFLVHDMKPPSYYKTVDTLVEARKLFDPGSRQLDFMAKRLHLNGKLQHDKDLFIRCKEGDPESLRVLRAYNEVDVVEGEGIYLKMRPYMRTHPNMGLYYETDELRCKNCGSVDVDILGTYPTPAQVYRAWRCKCGAVGRTEERLTHGKALLK